MCQFHFLREAAGPIYEADRHAKKAVRGVREIERKVEDRAGAEVVRGYCAAVRSAITDDGRRPLDSAGRRLRGRLEAVAGSLKKLCAGRKGRLGN